MPKRIDIASIAPFVGTLYPPPFHKPCTRRGRQKLGDAAGLTQFGVNLMRLEPGVWSSQRHWHTHEDEFVYVLEGEVVLVTDEGDEALKAGDCAGFKANDGNGHCLQNRSDRVAMVLEIGTRLEGGTAYYSDIDMVAGGADKSAPYRHRDGTPYENIRRRGPEDSD